MLFAKDFRKIARESLKGKWILAILVCLVAYFLGANPVSSTSGGSANYSFDEESTGAFVRNSGYYCKLSLCHGCVHIDGTSGNDCF